MNESNEKGCIERIISSYSELNKAEKKAAKYILDNPRDIVHFSIKELAESCQVSEATVFRLCNSLGYKGYQDLKINLAGSIIKPIENIHESINEHDDSYMIMNKVYRANVTSMEKTLKLNPPELLDEATKILLEASKIMFFGMGGSYYLAEDAYHKFFRTGIPVENSADSHWQAMYISRAKANDVVLAISNSGSNKELLDNIKLAKEHGLKVISITNNGKSPIATESDISFISYGEEFMFRSEAMESRLSTLMITDWLYMSVALKRKKDYLDNIGKIRKAIASKRL
ncbi:MAG: MurR/RpiR family transcriptional regulator [Clostridiales bacterium]|nr:MurR/RpiR family transcriptional regulator [Clostridiales bacterium]